MPKARGGSDNEINERRQSNMDGAVQDAAGMSVVSLVHVLIGALQVKIGDRMLKHEDRKGSEND